MHQRSACRRLVCMGDMNMKVKLVLGFVAFLVYQALVVVLASGKL